MTDIVQFIPVARLTLIFVPVLVVIAILWKWSLNAGNALYSIGRMLVQLLLIGYFLAFLFESDNALIVIAVLLVMLLASSWIALGTVVENRRSLYLFALYANFLGGGFTLLLVTQGVLDLSPWYFPQYFIPLAGMIFANTMNSVSLAAERLCAEMNRGVTYQQARQIALHAALIPVINSMFAVGLVSLPGMMTGQILSGVSPFIAARYQIMVMGMIFGSAGMASACFLVLIKSTVNKKLDKSENRLSSEHK